MTRSSYVEGDEQPGDGPAVALPAEPRWTEKRRFHLIGQMPAERWLAQTAGEVFRS